jgi:hypothetical protein
VLDDRGGTGGGEEGHGGCVGDGTGSEGAGYH